MITEEKMVAYLALMEGNALHDEQQTRAKRTGEAKMDNKYSQTFCFKTTKELKLIFEIAIAVDFPIFV